LAVTLAVTRNKAINILYSLSVLTEPMLARARMRAPLIDQIWAFFSILGRSQF